MPSALVASVLEELTKALGPIERALEAPSELSELIARFGWRAPPGTFSIDDLQGLSDLRQDIDQVRRLVVAAAEADDDAEATEVVSQAIDLVRSVFAKVRVLTAESPDPLPFPFDRPEFWATFPVELADDLLPQYLQSYKPLAYALFLLLGVIDEAVVDSGGAPGRIPYRRRTMRWGELGNLLEPSDVLRGLYGWGTDALEANLLLERLQLIASSLGILASIRHPRPDLLDAYYPAGNPHRASARELRLVFFGGSATADGSAPYELALSVLPVPPAGSTARPRGFAVFPSVVGTLPPTVDLGALKFEARGGFEIDRGVSFQVTAAGATAQTDVDGAVDAKLIAEYVPSVPLVVLGTPGSHRLELSDVVFGVDARGSLSDVDLRVVGGANAGRVVIDTSSSDGFMKRVFGEQPQILEFSALMEWSSATGVHFKGSAALRISIPLRVTLGPVELQTLHLDVGAADSGFQIAPTLDLGALLGPVAVAVEGIGFSLTASHAAGGGSSGTFGDLHLDLAFKPPTGAGLAVSAGAVTGGGFIRHDPATGSYAGILDLKFSDIGLVAIGIITTKFPGTNKQGFALFINIGVTFSPPIALPYNFSLQGCGGLCAVNRTMDTEALRSGLRNKTLDAILFPEDPILNANKIISDSERVFPIEEGRFVVGPVAKLGWGAKGLLTANLAIVLELPAPLVIALLGQVKVRVPQSDEAKVKLNLDFLGVLEIEKKTLSFDATLYDSKILVYDLSGDSALRMRWGANPQFAMSVGGFHPKFNAPANFPSLRRLTLALRSTSSFDLSCKMYHALTSNTLQFGARLDIHAEACGASLDGDLSFDTLLQFSPLEFEVGVSGGVAARYKGHRIASVRLSCDLSGPNPWHAKGKAEVSVMCWDVTARFNKTWGSDEKARLAKVDPLDPFLAELAEVGNWSASLLPRRTIVETLKSLEAPNVAPSDDETSEPDSDRPQFLAHPAGALEFRQRLLPLDMKLEKFRNADVKNHSRFDVRLELGDEAAAPAATDADPCPPPELGRADTEVKEHFARAQFKSLSKSERLSKPSFERFRAGVQVGPTLARVDGCVQECELEYESILIMPDGVRERTVALSRNWTTIKRMLAAAALRRAGLRNKRMGKFALGEPGRVQLDDEAYVVVDRATLRRVTVVHPADAPPLNQTQAEDLLDEAVVEHLVGPGSCLVVPAFEEVA